MTTCDAALDVHDRRRHEHGLRVRAAPAAHADHAQRVVDAEPATRQLDGARRPGPARARAGSSIGTSRSPPGDAARTRPGASTTWTSAVAAGRAPGRAAGRRSTSAATSAGLSRAGVVERAAAA